MRAGLEKNESDPSMKRLNGKKEKKKDPTRRGKRIM